jgi:hypothetical protein
MAKIEQWKRARDRADRIRGFAEDLQRLNGRGGYYVDKFRATVSISNTSIGYYGDSSAHQWDEEIIGAMKAEIKYRLREIALHAAKTAEDEAESYRKAAVSEALEVLKDAENG